MANNPIFIFAVIVLVLVAFGMIVAETQNNKPTDPVYYNSSSQINHTQGFIQTELNTAPNWIMPLALFSGALVLIGVIFLFKRR